jgi:hypothetical protein
MLTRRTFMVGSGITFMLLPLAACSQREARDGGKMPECSGIEGLSSLTEDHRHTVCIPAEDLERPPEVGQMYMTSVNDGHSHQIDLTRGQLVTLSRGGRVEITTTIADGHTHSFALVRMV